MLRPYPVGQGCNLDLRRCPATLCRRCCGLDYEDAEVKLRHAEGKWEFRCGVLIIESAAQDPLEFEDIPNVERVHSLLYHEVFDTVGTEEAPS